MADRTDIDPVDFASALIRKPSVTPLEAGVLDLLQARLEQLGFACRRMPFSEDGTAPVDNLYARIGTRGPVFMFAGHVDVVPVGDAEAWTEDPFSGSVRDGVLLSSELLRAFFHLG